jgi:cytochrome c556
MRWLVLASFGLFAAAAVAAPSSKARHIMHERHEGMEAIGKANKELRREVTSATPNVAAVRASSAKLARLASKASGWFPKGTGPEAGKTRAKPEIWQDPQDFSARLRDFQGAAKALKVAAASGDANAIKARYADLGKTCKACHDKYRSEVQH